MPKRRKNQVKRGTVEIMHMMITNLVIKFKIVESFINYRYTIKASEALSVTVAAPPLTLTSSKFCVPLLVQVEVKEVLPPIVTAAP